jgi:hypothetical protein
MTDQCKNCTYRGDIKACQAAECHKHDDWYSVKLNERIAELESMLESRTKEVDNWISKYDKSVTKQRAVITELEKERYDAVTAYNNCMTGNQIHIRDLEQQANGVRDFFTNHRPRISMGKSAIWEVDDVLVDECIDRLTTQAKALKEKGFHFNDQE